ncbi:hypothetical protein GS896_27460 [Rhodococcus hoagii]|nr:hypothetical protein [Prescottella equi]
MAGVVAAAAYIAETGTSPAPATTVGAGCGRCGFAGAVMTPVRQAVSNRFTGYGAWINPRSGVLCETCVWMYRHRPLRSEIHLVRKDSLTFEQLTEARLAKALSSPLTTDVAVIVPSRMGRKHVFDEAEWGHVATEDMRMPWLARDVEILGAMTRLRAAGFGASALAAAAPPFEGLRALPGDQWAAVFADWAALTPWRAAAPWWSVGLRASGG